MAYNKPDVFVTVDIEATSVQVPTPALVPVAVGEHYHVVKDAFAGYVAAGESMTIPYPQLPKSFNDPTKKLSVDIASQFAPHVDMILATGDRVDVTGMFTFGKASFTKAPFTTSFDGVPFSGALYVSYRALSDQYAGNNLDLLVAAGTADMLSLFGPNGVGPANPLGFAMWKGIEHTSLAVAGAALGSLPAQSGSGTYVGSIVDEVAAYSYVLDFLKGQDVYEIVALTHNDYVLDVVSAHVDAMSSAMGRSERRTVFSVSMDDFWPVRGDDSFTTWYSISATTAAGAVILNGGVAITTQSAIGAEFELQNGYTVKRIAAGAGNGFGMFVVNLPSVPVNGSSLVIGGETFEIRCKTTGSDDQLIGRVWLELTQSAFQPASNRIRVGDRLHVEGTAKNSNTMGTILYPGVAGNERLVEVTFENLTTAIDDLPTSRVRVYRELQGREQAEGLRTMAEAYSSERLVILAPDVFSFFVDGQEMDLPGYYVAFQLACEMCLVGQIPAGAAPGAFPMTGVRDAQFSVWKSSRYFTEEQLDTAASGGVTILVNDQKRGPVTSRQTLTTDMSKIEVREAILGVERDFLARTVRKSLRPELKKYRIDSSLLSKLQILLDAVGKDLSSPTSSSRCFKSVEVMELKQSVDQPDTVEISLSATHLYVLNYVRVNIKIVV